MHPVLRHDGVTEGRAALRDLVLVMREDEVEAAGVDVEGLPEQRAAHSGALDVPARTAAAPGARPARLRVGRGFPQHEVGRVLLVGRDLDPGARDQLVMRAARQTAIVFHAGHVEEHMALGCIGMAARDQALDQRDHLAHVLGGPRLDVGWESSKPAHVALVGGGRALRQRVDRLPVLGGAHHDLVVDVRDIPDIGHARIAPLQQPIENVEDDDRPRIADMDVVVDRGAADIKAHVRRIERHERLFFARQRVVNNQGHRPFSRFKNERNPDAARWASGLDTSRLARAGKKELRHVANLYDRFLPRN